MRDAEHLGGFGQRPLLVADQGFGLVHEFKTHREDGRLIRRETEVEGYAAAGFGNIVFSSEADQETGLAKQALQQHISLDTLRCSDVIENSGKSSNA